MYLILKHSHQLIAIITLMVFVARASYMFRGAAEANAKFFRIAPHLLYTLLLATGIALAVTLSFRLGDHPWLQAKLICLILFIAAALMTFKFSCKKLRIASFVAALVIFANIIVIAFSKSPFGFLAAF